MDRWHELREKPYAQLKEYKAGPNPWGILSPYTHAILGYRDRGAKQENVVALYYPKSAWAEKDAAELEKRWNSFRVQVENVEVLSLVDKCSPFSTTVVQETDSSVLVGTCPGDPDLWTHLFFMDQPLLFLVPDLEALK
jgi:hypothetical protein